MKTKSHLTGNLSSEQTDLPVQEEDGFRRQRRFRYLTTRREENRRRVFCSYKLTEDIRHLSLLEDFQVISGVFKIFITCRCWRRGFYKNHLNH